MKHIAIILAVLLVGCEVEIRGPLPPVEAQEKEHYPGGVLDGEPSKPPKEQKIEHERVFGEIEPHTMSLMIFYSNLCMNEGKVDFECVAHVMEEQIAAKKKTYEDAIELRNEYFEQKRKEDES